MLHIEPFLLSVAKNALLFHKHPKGCLDSELNVSFYFYTYLLLHDKMRTERQTAKYTDKYLLSGQVKSSSRPVMLLCPYLTSDLSFLVVVVDVRLINTSWEFHEKSVAVFLIYFLMHTHIHTKAETTFCLLV